jgi:hypothetical protein
LILASGWTRSGQSISASGTIIIAGRQISGQAQIAGSGVGGITISGAGITAQGQRQRGFGMGRGETTPARQYLLKMLKYPHAAVFDKGPVGVAVIRWGPSHGDTLSWGVRDGVLRVTEAGVSRWFELGTHTIESLAAALRASGFDLHVPDEMLPFSASVLLEDRDRLGWDNVLGFRSLLWVFLHAYSGELSDVEFHVKQALRQMVIWQAEDDWLDVWGGLYGVMRRDGESDASYQRQIPAEAFRRRVNALAIEKAILDITGYSVRILEPWEDIFTLDESALSGGHKMYDGDRVGYHLIQPAAYGSVRPNWSAVMSVIERNRAAGVLVLPPQTYSTAGIVYTGLSLDAGRNRRHVDTMVYEDRDFLDETLFLDDIGQTIQNQRSRHTTELRRASGISVAKRQWGSFTWSAAGLTWGSDYLVASKRTTLS